MTSRNKTAPKLILVGCSSGGLTALTGCLETLPPDYSIPIVIVQHRRKYERGLFEEVLQSKVAIRIKQADEKEKIDAACVYVAPPDYHLLVEPDMTLSLNSDPLVNYGRPSIDVLFESAADVCGDRSVGIVLTGANNDGANGIRCIRKKGGITIAQDPSSAEYSQMPQAAINTGYVQYVLKVAEIASFLLSYNGKA